MNGAKSKVIEDLEGAGVLGRLSPNNKSPHQRTARVRDFAGRGYCYLEEGLVDKGYRLMMLKWKKPRKVIEDEKGAGVWGGLAPIKKKMVSSRKALNHPHSHIY